MPLVLAPMSLPTARLSLEKMSENNDDSLVDISDPIPHSNHWLQERLILPWLLPEMPYFPPNFSVYINYWRSLPQANQPCKCRGWLPSSLAELG